MLVLDLEAVVDDVRPLYLWARRREKIASVEGWD